MNKPVLTINEKIALWKRIVAYDFSDLIDSDGLDELRRLHFAKSSRPVEDAFCQKIEIEHGYSNTTVKELLHEYRKFLFLATILPTSVCPSRMVDTIWHAHLLFTPQWKPFTERVLGYHLQHRPDLGLTSQLQRLGINYAKTYIGYMEYFGQPSDYWEKIPTITRGYSHAQKINNARNGRETIEDTNLLSKITHETYANILIFSRSI
jgi:hypothetical protein